ncbi:MAG: ABC transporter permease [Actinomycetia bacterium]|nr:ABC transporter permease [Actinomycetes bacterium]
MTAARPDAPAGPRPALWRRLVRPGSRRWVELIRNLAVRDVETRYKHSLLGLYWALINPLVMALIYSFVFGTIFHANSGTIPYVVFLLTGLTFWNLFNNGVMSATVSITGNAQLLAKLYFPRVVLPTAAVLARLIDFGFSFVILLVFIAVYRVPLHWSFLFLPLVLVPQILFTLGVSFLTAALNVLYRDMNQLIGLFLMLWMYLTPVMYPATNLPTDFQAVMLLNPMGNFVEMERDLLFLGHIGHPSYVWTMLVWTVFVYALGLRVFKRIEPLFAEVM